MYCTACCVLLAVIARKPRVSNKKLRTARARSLESMQRITFRGRMDGIGSFRDLVLLPFVCTTHERTGISCARRERVCERHRRSDARFPVGIRMGACACGSLLLATAGKSSESHSANHQREAATFTESTGSSAAAQWGKMGEIGAAATVQFRENRTGCTARTS